MPTSWLSIMSHLLCLIIFHHYFVIFFQTVKLLSSTEAVKQKQLRSMLNLALAPHFQGNYPRVYTQIQITNLGVCCYSYGCVLYMCACLCALCVCMCAYVCVLCVCVWCACVCVCVHVHVHVYVQCTYNKLSYHIYITQVSINMHNSISLVAW